VIGAVQEMLVEPRAAKITPGSAIHAKFSIPFTVAHAWIHNAVDLDSFDEGARTDTAVLALAAKVVAVRNPDWTRAHAASGGLVVTLTDGTRYEAMVMAAPGGPDKPLDDATLVDKFVACANRAAAPLGTSQAEALAARILATGGKASASRLLD
jgi:2-methylcitrate dehydratase PrpD